MTAHYTGLLCICHCQIAHALLRRGRTQGVDPGMHQTWSAKLPGIRSLSTRRNARYSDSFPKPMPYINYYGCAHKASMLSATRRRHRAPALRLKLTPVAADILTRIVSRKREELRANTISTAELRRCAESHSPARRDFAAALRSKRPAIISEIKKASPSKGVLVEDFRPAELAATIRTRWRRGPLRPHRPRLLPGQSRTTFATPAPPAISPSSAKISPSPNITFSKPQPPARTPFC